MAVRRERVVLELEDRFSGPLGRPIAATRALDKSLDDLDDSTVRTERDMDRLGTSMEKPASQSQRLSREVDRTSGRLRLLADAALLLGPALVPIGAIAVPAVTSLASQFGAAALAGGTAVLAFQGVGEALEAVNEAALEPSSKNLEAARMAMEKLSPAARDLVRQIQEMRPAFAALRDSAAAGLFPGLSAALTDLDSVLPNVERILFRVGDAAGELGADLGEALSSERGREFLSFIEAEMPRAVTELGHTVGNLAAGLGELWMAFAPLNRDVSGWLLGASRDFDRWAQGLSQTEGFRDFVDYIRTNGPRVAEAMGAIGNAVLQIVKAATPLGGPTLMALEAVADVIAAIAGSNYGTALIALAGGLTLVSRAVKGIQAIKATNMFQSLLGGADGATRSLSRMERVAAGAASALAGLAVVDALQGGLRDYSIGVESMTRSLLDLDSKASSLPTNLDGIANSIDRLANPGRAEALQDTISNALGGIGNEEEYDRAVAQIESLDAALSSLVQQGRADVAAGAIKGLDLTAAQTRDLMKLLPQYRDALAGAENQARLTGEAGAEGGRKAADGFNRATSAAQRFRNAVAAANAVLERRGSVRDYEQALDDFNKSVRQNGRSLDVTTAKGRANQAALDAIASSAVAMSQKMNATNRIKVLTAARGDLVDAARKLGMSRAEAQRLADRLLGLDKIRAQPQINLNTGQAMSALGALSREIDYVARPREARITITRHYAASGRDTYGGLQSRADGGTVLGPRLPYRDKVLLFAAPGEEIISNRHGEADRFRADRAAGRIPAYADGGEVAAMNRAPMMAAPSGGGRTHTVERVVERLPREFAVQSDIGPLVLRVVDSRLSDQTASRTTTSRTTYREPTLD